MSHSPSVTSKVEHEQVLYHIATVQFLWYSPMSKKECEYTIRFMMGKIAVIS